MRYTIILLGILSGCGEAPAPVTPAPGDRPPRIEFYGKVEARSDDGGREEIQLFYETSRPISGGPCALTKLVNDHPVCVSLFSAERDSAVIRVFYRSESHEATIRQDAPIHVQFENGSVELSFSLGATTAAPIKIDDPILNAPATARRLDPAVESRTTISGYRVLATKAMTPNQVQRVRTFLTGNGYLALHGYDCFDPGTEFQFGEGDEAIYVIVCLECWKIRITTADSKTLNVFYGLNRSGVEELKALYKEIF